MKWFAIMLLSLLLVTILSPVVFVFQLLRKLYRRSDLSPYFWSVVIGLDQLGGSIVYGKVNWTISGYTGYLAKRGNRYAVVFEKILDSVLGDNHCRNAMVWDMEYDAAREVAV